MKPRPTAIMTLLAAAILAAAPAAAQVQTKPLRPNRSLFGGGIGDTSQRLVLRASLGAGYDDDLKIVAAPGALLPPIRHGLFGVASSALSYSVDRSRVSASLSAGAYGRYYRGLARPLVGSYDGSGSVAFTLSSRTSLSLSGQAGLFPQNLAVFAGLETGAGTTIGAPLDPTAFANTDTFRSARTDVQFGQSISKRVRLTASYGYYTNNAWSLAGKGLYAGQTGSAGFTVDIAKGLGFRLGYMVSGAGFGSSAQTPFRSRGIDGGLDFNRSLSLTRRSSLSFGTGVVGLADQNLRTRYIAIGHVTFAYEIGRSWGVNVGASRSANFFQTFGQPVVLDQANLGLGGLIGRRLQVSASGGFSKGAIGTAVGAPGYSAANAGVSLEFGLTRDLALGAGYSYYRYVFGSGAVPPPGLLSRLDRQSVRVSLDVWVPLVTRARRN